MNAKYVRDKYPEPDSTGSENEQKEIALTELHIQQKASIVDSMMEAVGIEPRVPLNLSLVRSSGIKSLLETDCSIFEDVKIYEDFFVSIFRLNSGDKAPEDFHYIWRYRNADVFMVHHEFEVSLEKLSDAKDTILEKTQNVLETFLKDSNILTANHAYRRFQERFSKKFGSPVMMYTLMDKESCISRILEYIPVVTL